MCVPASLHTPAPPPSPQNGCTPAALPSLCREAVVSRSRDSGRCLTLPGSVSAGTLFSAAARTSCQELPAARVTGAACPQCHNITSKSQEGAGDTMPPKEVLSKGSACWAGPLVSSPILQPRDARVSHACSTVTREPTCAPGRLLLPPGPGSCADSEQEAVHSQAPT